MPQAAIDYDALAQQARGSNAPPVDYDAMASAVRGDSAAKNPPPFNQPRWADTVEDRLVGAGKRLMRAGQQLGNIPKVVGLPGLSDVTDQAYGLPPGTSWNESEPSNAAQKEGGDYAANLGTMALMEATPKVVNTEAIGNAIHSGTQSVGRTVEDQGTKLQTALDSLNKRATKTGGAWGYVMRGKPIQGLYAGLARLGANLTANGLQGLGQLISDDPDAAGKLTEIVEKATNPEAGVTLATPQANFISSITDQLNAGRTLSGAQRQYLTTIYRAMPK